MQGQRGGRATVARPFSLRASVLDALVDVADEGSGSRAAELFVEGGSGLCGDGLVEGLAFLLELRDVVTDANQHLVIVGELGFGTDRAVSGNDDGVGSSYVEVIFVCKDHAVDVAAGGVIDERIERVPEGVAGVEDVGLCEIDREVRIGVGGVVVAKGESCLH